MTNSKGGLDEILGGLYDWGVMDIAEDVHGDGHRTAHIEQAKAQIVKAIPEKFVIEPLKGLKYDEEANGQEWYNQAIDDVKRNLGLGS